MTPLTHDRRPPVEQPSMPQAVRAVILDVAVRHGVTLRELVAPGRTARVVRARQEAFAAVRAMPGVCGAPYSYPRIGGWFGGRHHATVIFGVRAHGRRTEADIAAWRALGKTG